MRCDILYLDDVVECQGEAFVCAVEDGLDLASFSEYYLKSKTRAFIDDGAAFYCTMLGKELYDWCCEKDGEHIKEVKRAEGYTDTVLADWLGQFYAIMQWEIDMESRELLNIAEPKEVIKRFGVLHDMDIKLAVQKWIEHRASVRKQ